MTINRNLNHGLTTIKIRILNSHGNRTINILTRSNNNIAVVINLGRNVLTVLILSRHLRVIIRVRNLDARILLISSRLNRLHARIINRGLQRHDKRVC